MKKITAPVQMEGETVAVKVTVCPAKDGLGVEVTESDALYKTVCVRTGEVLVS